jgi:ribosomal protein S18 acetylase RimI-like enzyme
MEIKTLESVAQEDIRQAFNEAFADYFVSIQLTPEQLAWKMKMEKIHLPYSTGVFSVGKLGGFMLHAVDLVDGEKVVYNAGTGVIPALRGHGFTKKMYAHILPKLQQEGVDSLVLEVLVQNIQAIKSYEAAGYTKYRKLISFKGEMTGVPPSRYVVREISMEHIAGLSSWGDYVPSWQNSNHILAEAGDSIQVFGAFADETMTGYVIYNPVLKRIHQLAVNPDHRRNGTGTALLHFIQQTYGTPLVLLNIDSVSEGTIAFLQSTGLSLFIEQYEMKMNLTQL